MNTTFYMKPMFNKIFNFIRKEWFLLIMLVTISLIILLFELL
ncbi:MAG: hypothetical protein OJF59_002467 [Cytophagales bacterium]|nr:MAG: hypothetical protein OJF59_002467 [Cytophagales bacterium]